MGESAWMLDTNTLSDLIRNPRGPVRERLAATAPDDVCTSVVVACELRFGAHRKGSRVLSQRVEQMLDNPTVLAFDPPADRHYADIRAALGPVLARTRLAIRWRHPSTLLTAEYRP